MPGGDDAGACTACGAGAFDPVWPEPAGQEFVLRRCRGCGLTATRPRLGPEAMAPYYDARYYGQDNVRFGALFERLVGWFRRRRADKICGFVASGRALDIGCGRGHILANLRQRGFAVEGVELNPAAVRHARDVLGIDVAVGGLEPDRYPEGRFDAVILWHVLEHLPDVGRAVDSVARILRPGGLLVVSVPNLASWQAALTRYHWFHLDLPRHYYHFSADWLREYLGQSGFEVVEINHFAFEQNPFGWIQSVLNAAHLRPNLLYDILKSRSARAIDAPFRRHPVQSLLSLLGALLLLGPACFLLLPESLFRRGATIDLFAIRR